MSTICQTSPTLTTTTLRTTSTVYQLVVERPTTSTVVIPTSACQTIGYGSSTCATSLATRLTVVTPVTTVTSQIVQTQLNTLYGTSCRVVSSPPPALTSTSWATEYVTITGDTPSTLSTFRRTTTSSINQPRPSVSHSTVYPGDTTTGAIPANTAVGAVAGQPVSSHNVPVAAIVGGVIVGSLIIAALVGFLVYYFFFSRKRKGYRPSPGDESTGLTAHDEQPVYSDQTSYNGYSGQDFATGQRTGQHERDQEQELPYPNYYFHPRAPASSASLHSDNEAAQYISRPTEMAQSPFHRSPAIISWLNQVPQPSLSSTPPVLHAPVPYRGYAEIAD